MKRHKENQTFILLVVGMVILVCILIFYKTSIYSLNKVKVNTNFGSQFEQVIGVIRHPSRLVETVNNNNIDGNYINTALDGKKGTNHYFN